MKLDRNKKYKGLELTWESRGLLWIGKDLSAEKKLQATVYDSVMQRWLDAGYIKPVKQTKIVRVEGFRLAMGRDGVPFVRGWDSFMDNHLVRESAETKPVTLEFEVEVDE